MATRGAVRVDGKSEPDVLGVSLGSVVPVCFRMNFESDGERIVRPLPAFGEARLEAGVADGIQPRPDDGEVVVEEERSARHNEWFRERNLVG